MYTFVKSFAMKWSQKLMLVDTVVQGILMTGIAIGPILAFTSDYNEWMGFSLYGMVLLGAWQFFGNLSWSLLLGASPSRKNYLITVIVYFLLGIAAANLIEMSAFSDSLGLFYWFGIPFGIAIWYFRISAGQLVASYRPPRSFWDI